MESVAIFTKGEKEKQWNGGGGGGNLTFQCDTLTELSTQSLKLVHFNCRSRAIQTFAALSTQNYKNCQL